MTTRQTVPLETVLPTLSTDAMQAFCQDLDGMLGIAMTCAPSAAAAGTLDEIKSFFAKCAAVYSIQPEGVLNRPFTLIFDKAGLFLLSGLIVMLPQDTIRQQCRQGTLDSARKLMDTVKEVGNLLVGSWNRIYREQLSGHQHHLQTGTQIVDPWENPREIFGLEMNSPCIGIVWEVTVQDYPPFKCAAVFPDLKVGPAEAAPPPPVPTAEKTPTPQAEQKKTAEPVPAKPEPTKPAPQPAAAPAPVPVSEPTHPQPAAEPAVPEPVGQSGSEQPGKTDHPVYEAIVKMTRSDRSSSSSADPQILERPARSVMQTRLLWLSPNDSVETALQRMQQNSTRYALVEEQGRLAGILSRGDLNAAVSPYLKSPFEPYRRPLDEASLQIRIKWFMSRLVHVADPDMPVWKMMETMCRHEIRALPVQDAAGVVLGLVTVPDIFGILLGADVKAPSLAGPQPAQPAVEQQVQPAQEEN